MKFSNIVKAASITSALLCIQLFCVAQTAKADEPTCRVIATSEDGESLIACEHSHADETDQKVDNLDIREKGDVERTCITIDGQQFCTEDIHDAVTGIETVKFELGLGEKEARQGVPQEGRTSRDRNDIGDAQPKEEFPAPPCEPDECKNHGSTGTR